MSASDSAKQFAGSVPKIYETHLVPLIFEPYAEDIAARVAARPAAGVLEIAAGTGVVTRALARTLPRHVSLVATDLNQPMIDEAAAVGTERPVEWRQADAMSLPFESGAFDAVVCQFGVMFFPDRPKAFAEARRVLRRGGTFIFNVWDTLDANEFANEISAAVAVLFPNDPPSFLARTPYAYHQRADIERDLAAGGFTAPPLFRTVEARSRAHSAREAAIAFCQGTPLRAEIESRDSSRLGEATDAAAAALAQRFGSGAVDGRIRAHVIEAVA